ncbi:MAG: MmcQ/YjbR family DNA-binding protein [Bacteroidia bacterium]|nr:MmcQ/YjbR family DNA-binding protein [Bacteroidia bacterium]
MNIETLRERCLSLPGTSEGLPFGPDTLVLKVMGKMFALVSLEDTKYVNLKCDPEYAVELREQYPERITPGWHMNKVHWNSVSLIDNLREDLIDKLILHSYDMVVKTLKKAEKEALEELKKAGG